MKNYLKLVSAITLDKNEISRLPKWARDNIEIAVLVGSNYKTIQLRYGIKYSLDNTINNLDGSEWTKSMQSKKKEPHLLHADIANALNEIPSLYFRGSKIWADQTIKLPPYGYPLILQQTRCINTS